MNHSDHSPSGVDATERHERFPAHRAAHRSHRISTLCAMIAVYVVAAYIILPLTWLRYERRHPAIDAVSKITVTGNQHPGDPLNVALIGSEADLKRAMLAAGWFVADPLGISSDLRIAADTVLDRPYETAPVSNLFLWGRREDVAFEQPAGDSPGHRHHVRFWKSAKLDASGQPAWLGSASYDQSVGFSHTTGQITHHIAADVDSERDHLMDSLQQAGQLNEIHVIDGFHKIREGRNGGGDPWHTDGRLLMAAIVPR